MTSSSNGGFSGEKGALTLYVHLRSVLPDIGPNGTLDYTFKTLHMFMEFLGEKECFPNPRTDLADSLQQHKGMAFPSKPGARQPLRSGFGGNPKSKGFNGICFYGLRPQSEEL